MAVEPAPLEVAHRRLERIGLVGRRAAISPRLAIGHEIRLQEDRGAVLDHAVEPELDHVGSEPLPGRCGPSRLQAGHRICLARPAPRLPLLGHGDPCREELRGGGALICPQPFGIGAGIVPGGDAQAMEVTLGPEECGQEPFVGWPGEHIPEQDHGVLDQHARRDALRIALDAPIRRVRRRGRDPRQLERAAVDPRRVPVERVDEHRPIGHHPVEDLPRGASAGKYRVVPPVALDPRGLGMGVGECPDGGTVGGQVRQPVEAALELEQAPVDRVDVRVLESGQDGLPLEPNDRCRRTDERVDVRVGAKTHDSPARHGQGRCRWAAGHDSLQPSAQECELREAAQLTPRRWSPSGAGSTPRPVIRGLRERGIRPAR